MREAEMRQVASLIARAVRVDPASAAGEDRLRELADEVTELVVRFPAYPRTHPTRPLAALTPPGGAGE
jgi:glycine hydroxymethyltransferase